MQGYLIYHCKRCKGLVEIPRADAVAAVKASIISLNNGKVTGVTLPDQYVEHDCAPMTGMVIVGIAELVGVVEK